jgi:hypothetical protein
VDPVRAITDAVLYEGYILWPYRKSATKNQQRWTFGGVYPRGHSEGREDDPWTMQTQCLLEGDAGASVEVSVRFLQVVEREVARMTAGGLEPTDELIVGEERYLAWEEALERELSAAPLRIAGEEAVERVAIAIEPGTEQEDVLDARGRPAGAVVRRWERLEGAIEVRGEPIDEGAFRVTVRVENTTPFPRGGSREEALRRTFCSTHAVLRSTDARFVSLTDPPERLAAAASACRNEGVWPVLVGEPGQRDTMLASPIILEDYPRIAPESPGDLFDGAEIDQLLILNILSLTDEEKAEMRATDPRAREILDRTENLNEEELMRLHGAIREFGAVRG